MMLVKFNPAHLNYFSIQKEQGYMSGLMEDESYQELMVSNGAMSIVSGGRVLLIGGVLAKTTTTGEAWSVLSCEIGREFVTVSRIVHDFLMQSGYIRMETAVRRDYVKGHRWAKLLGFVNETPSSGMRYYGLNLQTYDMYALYNVGAIKQ